MRLTVFFLCIFLHISCKSGSKSYLDYKEVLGKPLSEISGLIADGKYLWAITDKPNAIVYKLDLHGRVEQEVNVTNATAQDVEAVTKDSQFVYIGDVGDNDGTREDRQIIKVSKTLSNDKKVNVTGEIISFRFSNQDLSEKKKKNNYDCESIISFGDSLYLFTKRREDFQTELFVLPKTPGNYTARSLGLFNSKGLITDASINNNHNELALIGYNKGHRYPFILLFSNIKGTNFFSDNIQRIELADKAWDWQLEGITYSDNNEVYFSCEKTKQVESTLYAVKRENLNKLNKKR